MNNDNMNQLAKDEHIAENVKAKRSALYGYDAIGGIWRRVAVDTSGNFNISASISGADGAITDGVSSSIKATVKDLTNSNPLTVAITDGNGDQITSFGGGTQYTEGDTDATLTGTVSMAEGASNTATPLQLDASNNLKVSVQNSSIPVTDNGGSLTVDGTVAISNASIPVTDNGGSLTVDGTVAISNTTFPVTDNGGSLTVDGTIAATQSGTWTLGANSGVDVGDVTINNAAGASAVNIQDGGNSITVDGTVTANAGSGTFAVSAASLPLPSGASTETTLSSINTKTPALGQATMANSQPVAIASNQSAIPITDNSGSLTVDAPVGTPVFVRLSDGSSAIATLPVSIAATVATKEQRASTPSQTSVSVTNTNTAILASNANRLGFSIYNEGAATCYLKLGSTASTTSYTVQITSGGYYECPFNYTGAVDGITSAGTAQLRITELT